MSQKGITGKVTVEFTIDENGKLVGIETQSATNTSFALEMHRALRRSPLWTPAVKDGKLVPYKYKWGYNFYTD